MCVIIDESNFAVGNELSTLPSQFVLYCYLAMYIFRKKTKKICKLTSDLLHFTYDRVVEHSHVDIDDTDGIPHTLLHKATTEILCKINSHFRR